MSKYIDKDRVLEYIIFGVVGKDITCGELTRVIESLPTIEVSEDCISKSWLKNELDKWSLEEGRKDAWDNWNKAIETLLEIIDDAPSVTTEQSSMVGEWNFKSITNKSHVTGQCSLCKERRVLDNYCSNCGAKMKG